MRLVDNFLKVFAFVSTVVKQGTTELKALRERVEQLISESGATARKDGVTEEDYKLALFAVVAWADEIVLCSELPDTVAWEKLPLQTRYFNTTRAGVEFYTKLEALTSQQSSVREVYYVALALGFCGKLIGPDDRSRLGWLKEQQLQVLLEDRERMVLEGKQPLFPDSYPIINLRDEDPKPRAWFASIPLAPLVGPPAVVVVLYISFVVILKLVTHNLLANLH